MLSSSPNRQLHTSDSDFTEAETNMLIHKLKYSNITTHNLSLHVTMMLHTLINCISVYTNLQTWTEFLNIVLETKVLILMWSWRPRSACAVNEQSGVSISVRTMWNWKLWRWNGGWPLVIVFWFRCGKVLTMCMMRIMSQWLYEDAKYTTFC